jgi:hypothetical protein
LTKINWIHVVTAEIVNELLLRLCSSRLSWERADRVWYRLTGRILTWRFGDDGRWGDYDMDRNPPPPKPRLCAHCGEEVILPGDHVQINRDFFHLDAPCLR